ncbi:TM0106 family RecB-like putative nuclease [Kytococcus sedentarius]|uniref:TM0106 family RecB-like putative nuclease n=1 Tax=Kytococcus sedentarius TaxID=1276 RepID=UPI0035BC721B
MFLLDDGSLATSAQDLRVASECEFALLNRLDVTLGRVPRESVEDPMLERLAELGTAHEERELARLQAEHPGGVVVGERPRGFSREALEQGMAWTVTQCGREAVQVVHQAPVLLTGSGPDGEPLVPLSGLADFVVRTDAGWRVSDTKLAAHSTVASMLQVAAYAEALAQQGVPVAPEVDLVLGTGSVESHPLGPTVAVVRDRWARLSRLLREHGVGGRDGEALEWGAPGIGACGRCEVCAPRAAAADDLLGVARMSLARRKLLHGRGITTMAELATATTGPRGMRESDFATLRDQAALQVRARELTGEARRQDPDAPEVVLSEVVSAEALDALPEPSPGDVFFDFEGDPLWRPHPGAPAGLEYLFGVEVLDLAGEDPAAYGPADEHGARYRAWWAHDRAAEKQALADFLTWLGERRRRHPDLHVYHYAAYEVTALKRLTAAHGLGAEELDDLLRQHVFVDLYATVRAGIRVSQPSYSIKKLEPLYMPARGADGVTGGADSIVEYQRYCSARDVGDTEGAAALLERIRAYNEVDCESTWRLRDWLLERHREHLQHHGQATDLSAGGPGPEHARTAVPGAPGGEDGEPDVAGTPTLTPEKWVAAHRVEESFAALDLPPRGERTAREQALAMLGSAPQYYRREHKPHWWAHFERLALPVAEWPLTGDVLVVDRATWTSDWYQPTPRSNPRRTLEARVDTGGRPLAPGTSLVPIFGSPLPDGLECEPGYPHAQWPSAAEVLESHSEAASGLEVCTLELARPKGSKDRPGIAETDCLPVGFGPTAPPGTANLDAALLDLAATVLAGETAGAELPASAGLDLLARRPPRLNGQAPAGTDDAAAPPTLLPQVGEPGIDTPLDAVTAAVALLQNSYLAVQGPPGTGKTYLGSRVVRSLVQAGWRVGVVAQSHAAVENFLAGCVRAGVPDVRVAKAPASGRPAPGNAPWTALRSGATPTWISEQLDAGHGFVVGGTAWTFSHPDLLPECLDLLVVDEAGQFSLAPLLACSRVARNLLLLGDPQQLPQVSQGIHPEPLDASALGWLVGSEHVLPPQFGYFLDTTWRMHPALTRRVSALAYDGRLGSHDDVTTARRIEGVEPGLHVHVVDHQDNSVASPEEADEVTRLVGDLVGRRFIDTTRAPGEQERLLAPEDVLVVAPYNAQVNLLRTRLAAAGFGDTPVGAVDAFQGQEAPVVVLSMTASARDRVSRGMAFLFDVHRLNVAISRGQVAAHVVRSAALTDIAPASPRDLLALGSFLELTAPE